jgi:hypothetical protein
MRTATVTDPDGHSWEIAKELSPADDAQPRSAGDVMATVTRRVASSTRGSTPSKTLERGRDRGQKPAPLKLEHGAADAALQLRAVPDSDRAAGVDASPI